MQLVVMQQDVFKGAQKLYAPDTRWLNLPPATPETSSDRVAPAAAFLPLAGWRVRLTRGAKIRGFRRFHRAAAPPSRSSGPLCDLRGSICIALK